MARNPSTRSGGTTLAVYLLVVRPFGNYQRGDRITEPAEVDAVLAGENADCCHKLPIGGDE